MTSAVFPGDTANDATLAALTVGSLALSPAFDADKLTYTATATGTSDTVTASPKQARARVTITHGSETYPNGAAIKWNSGANKVEIAVEMGVSRRVYTVTVTKS